MATCFAYGQTGSGKTHVRSVCLLHGVHFPRSSALLRQHSFLIRLAYFLLRQWEVIFQESNRTALKEFMPWQVWNCLLSVALCDIKTFIFTFMVFFWHDLNCMLTPLRFDVISSFPLAANDVFTYLNHRRFSSLDLSAYVSFFEIYNGKVRRNLPFEDVCCDWNIMSLKLMLELYEIFFLELGVWPAEQEGQAAGPGGWETASSGCGPGGGVRVHRRGGHQDDTDWHCIQVVTVNRFLFLFF